MITELLAEVFYQYQTAIIIMFGLTIVFISNNTVSKRKKNYLFKIILFDFILMICESVTNSILTPDIEMINLRITLDIAGYIIRPMLIIYFYLLVSEKRNTKLNTLIMLPLTIDFVACITAYFSPMMFYYTTTEDGTHFTRGPLGFIPFAVSGCYLLILIVDSIRYFRKGREKTSFAVIYSAIIVILGSILETVFQKRIIVNFAMLSTLIYFLLLYFKTIMEQEAEIVRQMRIEMMYSQIGPHFIFNTLSAIYGLVDKDQNKAKLAIDKFSDYLRGNIDSIGKNGPVPFEEELRHIDAYIWIEKMRFGDDLTVEYDIDTMDFKIPPLSVQPLVENAIKHGIHKKPGDGKVIISTREKEDYYLVIVKDNGVGFDTSILEKNKEFEIKNATDRGLGILRRKMTEKEVTPDGKRGHVGLSNTSMRLATSGLGKLEIQSTPGEGTRAIITIYKNIYN